MQVTHSWDCDSQVDHDAWFGAGAQRVAANQINRSRRCHVELAFCCVGHQEKRDLNCTCQPWQVTQLNTERFIGKTWLQVYMWEFVEIWKHMIEVRCPIMKPFLNSKVLHTSTSEEFGTVWSSLVTAWMKESICRFLRSLRATSFSSSSIYNWW